MGQLTNFLSQEMPSMSLGVRCRWVSKTDVVIFPELCFCSDESDTNQGLQANGLFR